MQMHSLIYDREGFQKPDGEKKHRKTLQPMERNGKERRTGAVGVSCLVVQPQF